MTIDELLLEIKKIPISMINFDNKILNNENYIDYNIKFLKRKLKILEEIYNNFISEEVQEYINPTKIRLICQDLEDIINYINELISYLIDASHTLEADIKALFYDGVLENGTRITNNNYQERYCGILNLMELYMNENHVKFQQMYITNMDISDVQTKIKK